METQPREFDARLGFDAPEKHGSLIDIDLKNLVGTIERNKFWIAGIIAASMLLGVLATMLAVPRYVATSKVLVDTKADQIIEGSELKSDNESGWDTERFLQTQVDIIKSRALALRVVKEGKLADDGHFYAAFGAKQPQPEDLKQAAAASGAAIAEYRARLAADLLQGALSTEVPVQTRVIPIRVKTIDPVWAARLANAYAQGYIKANLAQKFDASAYARDFLAGQLDEARDRLATSERDLNQYSRAAGLIRVANQGQDGNSETTLSVTNDSLVQANNAAGQAMAERVAAQDRWETIAKEPVLAIPQVLANPAVQDIVQRKTEVQADLAKEKARHLDGHPAVQALRAQIAEMDARIQSIGGSIKRSVYLDYKATLDKEKSLEGKVDALRTAALDEQDRGVQYAVLKRVADTNRTLYDTLLARFNELNASAGAASNNVSLVDAAEVPSSPSSPNLMLNLALALIAGVILAGAFVLLREHLDDEIRSPEEAEQKLGVPMLGVIPLADTDVAEALLDSRSSISEAYHTLVTNLMYASNAGLPKSLLITSSSEDEGKSTTASAIALDLARLGRNVLLIDADLRRPTLHLKVDGNSDIGLTAVLAGRADLDSALRPGPEKNLTYMTALPIPPDPSLLLGGWRLPQVIATVRDRFDVVIIDGPPLLGISDSATLASHADGVLLMVNAGKFHKGAAKSTLRRLKLVNARVLGAVVTKFNPDSAIGSYSYYGQTYYQYEHSGKA